MYSNSMLENTTTAVLKLTGNFILKLRHTLYMEKMEKMEKMNR